MKIKKGDNVIVVTGKDKGKSGKVLDAFPDRQAVLVEGLNMRKRHQRGTRSNQKGQIIDVPHPIHVSNVMVVDGSGKPSRIGYKVENGKKVRILKKSGATLA